jgi:hypothetical protein
MRQAEGMHVPPQEAEPEGPEALLPTGLVVGFPGSIDTAHKSRECGSSKEEGTLYALVESVKAL